MMNASKVKSTSLKLGLIVTALLLIMMLVPAQAFAATGSQDGINVGITTDKGSYATGDTVSVTLKVDNTNALAVSDITLEVTLPQGLTLKTGQTTYTIASLAAGGEATYTLTALAETSGSAQPALAKTGDDLNLILIVLVAFLALGGGAALFASLKKRKKEITATGVGSLFLCLVLLTSLAPLSTPAFAATHTKDFTMSQAITVDGSTKQISVKITYTYDGGIVDVTGVSLDRNTATLSVGGIQSLSETQQLTVTVVPSDADNKNVTWTSDAESVATVSNTGLVTAVSAGTATITVTTEDGGKQATCTVTVGSLVASNAEAAKITGFAAAGENIIDKLVFVASGYDSLTPSATLTLVDVKTGAANPGDTASLDAYFSGAFLSLNTQKTVDTTDLTYVGVIFTVTYNGVTSNEQTLDISALFGADTTTGKLRTDAPKVKVLRDWVIESLALGTTSIPLNVTLSSGVSLHKETSNNPPGVTSAYIVSGSGGVVTIETTGSPTAAGDFTFRDITMWCEGTSYVINGDIEIHVSIAI